MSTNILQYVNVVLLFLIVGIHLGAMAPGGYSTYERGGDARRKFWIKPLKETDLGVAQAFLTPKRDHVKTQTILYI